MKRNRERLRLYDRYGQQLYAVATTLTGDPDLAEQIVMQAISVHGDGQTDLRDLSAAVWVAWLCWAPADGTDGASQPSSLPTLTSQLHALPDDQRVALALCRFGGHTYRQVAELLELPAETVARLLGDALRALVPAGTWSMGTSPAA